MGTIGNLAALLAFASYGCGETTRIEAAAPSDAEIAVAVSKLTPVPFTARREKGVLSLEPETFHERKDPNARSDTERLLNAVLPLYGIERADMDDGEIWSHQGFESVCFRQLTRRTRLKTVYKFCSNYLSAGTHGWIDVRLSAQMVVDGRRAVVKADAALATATTAAKQGAAGCDVEPPLEAAISLEGRIPVYKIASFSICPKDDSVVVVVVDATNGAVLRVDRRPLDTSE